MLAGQELGLFRPHTLVLIHIYFSLVLSTEADGFERASAREQASTALPVLSSYAKGALVGFLDRRVLVRACRDRSREKTAVVPAIPPTSISFCVPFSLIGKVCLHDASVSLASYPCFDRMCTMLRPCGAVIDAAAEPGASARVIPSPGSAVRAR